jgi:phenylacetate-CoA ligase
VGFAGKRRLYESLPGWVRGGVRLVPFSWLAGPSYRRTLARGDRIERASEDEIRAFQSDALGRILDFATTEVPAYRAHRRAVERHEPLEALRDFPLLDKDRLQEHRSEYLPHSLPRIPHYEITTGGTSGNQLRFFVQDDSQSVETAFVHRVWRRVGYNARSTKATFRGVPFAHLPRGVYWQPNPIYREIQFSPFHMSEGTLPAYVERLRAFAPDFLHGYPSAIDILAEYILRERLAGTVPPVKAALLASEACEPDQRERIERAFDTRVFPIYGHSERLILGAECESETVYHHVPDYGILEIVDEAGRQCLAEGESGELVGTGLWNRAMPLIRYRTGDLATRLSSCCSCGRRWERFTDVEGRWKQEMLEGADGGRISLTALNMHGPVLANVVRYQYVQKGPGRCLFRVVPAPGFGEDDRARIENAFADKVGDKLDIRVELVDRIELTDRGKLRRLVRE